MVGRGLRWGALVATWLAITTLAGPAAAEDAAAALQLATQQIDSVAGDVGAIERVIKRRGKKATPPERRIADATLLMGVKDYERAADVLNEVIEKYKNHPTAYPDGLRLLAETYFLSGQHRSARRIFRRIVDQEDPRFSSYQEQAYVRLVDVALRTGDLEPLRELLPKMDAAGAGGSSSALSYAKGKAQYALGDPAGASSSLNAVVKDSEHIHQAQYLLGVLAVKEATPAETPAAAPAPAAEGEEAPPPEPAIEESQAAPRNRYVKAIEAFRAVTRLPPDSTEHRHVIDLAWLAMGRLYYESDRWTESVEAYNHIDRGSPEFGTMLYELAWVYVRLGDVVRARRALEVLAVAAPQHQEIADAQLLRADLMLRAGQFSKSLKVYESVQGTYESMRDRVDAFLQATADPGAYFDTLSQDQLELFETGSALPKLALRWAREGEDGNTAFAIIDDITISRRLIKQSNDMVDRLNAVLSSRNRVRAMPGLRVGAEKGLSLLNTLGMARLRLAHGLDDVQDDDDLSAQLLRVRKQRKALEARLGAVPITAGDFAGRESDAKRQWNRASQALQRLQLELDTLQATINGLQRMVKDGPQAGVARDPGQVQTVMQALGEQQQLVKQYKEQMTALRRLVEAGKVQVGFGDQRFVEDDRVRAEFTKLLWQEVQLSQRGGGGAALAAYAKRVAVPLKKADGTDQRIGRALAELDKLIADRAGALRKVVARETANLVDYSVRLEQLDQEARLVVGGVALRNFRNVRDRLKNIVLRADVGITEEAWEVREEQLTRVRRLRIERARGVRRLEEELAEVLDDSGDPEDEQ